MRMNASDEVLRETDHVKEHCGNPSVDALRQELRANEQTPPRNPVGPCVPDAGAFETFVGGTGI
jgi:hypothetical protein